MAISICSCNTNKLSTMLFNMRGQEIVFDDLVPNLYGRNLSSGNVRFPEKFSRLIVYYDSTECQSCRINKLYEWENVIKKENTSNGKFEVMFVFSPNSNQSPLLKRTLATTKFSHVVWLDEKNVFLRNNSFIPRDIRFHVFLLDKNNKIIFVGSPLDSKEMCAIFNETLDNLLLNNGEYISEQKS